MPEFPCLIHADEPALSRCESCGRGMCGACWIHDLGGKPWCEDCLGLLREPPPVIAYAAIAVMSAGLLAAIVRKIAFFEPLFVWIGWAVMAGMIAWGAVKLYGRAKQRRLNAEPRSRDPAIKAPERVVGSAYRGRLRRIIRRAAPPVSGAMTAMVVIAVLALTAGVIPSVLKLPLWIEWEIVLGAWWVAWTTSFTVLLYRGWRVASDAPTIKTSLDRESSGGVGLGDGFDIPDVGCDAEGCAGIILVGLALLAALVVAWLLVEFVLPVLFAAAYLLVVRGLARVANDHHGCEGKLAKSVLWGGVWAALYTAPISGLIWVGHAVLKTLK